jgi:hypothetical protein
VSELDASEELIELALMAIDHGVESVKDGGGPLVPFAITETPAGRELARFAAETLEEGQEQARRHVREAADAVRAAIAYDGFVTLEEERSDAILVEAQERGQPACVILAQRYRPAGRLRKFATLGNPAVLGDAEPLF